MKKLMIAALAVASCSAFADFDTKAKADGFYDVQLTLKRLVHVEKKISKSYSLTTEDKVKKYEDALRTANEEALEGTLNAATNQNQTSVKLTYTRFDYTMKDNDKIYKSKILSQTYKGLYAPTAVEDGNGKVYLWSTLAADKVKKTKNPKDPRDIIQPKPTDKDTKSYSGYVAYEVPLAMDGEFQKTHDDKVAGGFTGENEVAEDGTNLDFGGLTAFGTGTKDKDGKGGLIKSVAGNVASKSDTDKVGAYGTWKINHITSSTFNDLSVKQALAKRGCVELINEQIQK